ncbi:CBS domain-containing protein [Shimia sp. R10_1]|uniref:CBS domain-containing protein n=2 Tax=unclassified Shimia TaxID=2630038 RepID=UPI001ADC67F1|nr:CBS domain-containing protein [Shimia sp. R10_1]MBO9474242.1 CBS domain-containing protein [Shimia sp. R10_1]
MGLTCADVMVSPDLQKTIHPDASVAEALAILKERRSRFLPVVDETGKYHGVFSAPTMLKLLLPKAATIGLNTDSMRVSLDHLSFMNLDKDHFSQQVEMLKQEKVSDNMSDPSNIPVTAPDTPIMEGIFLVYKYKRHVMLVEPNSQRFVGTVSANSLIDKVF